MSHGPPPQPTGAADSAGEQVVLLDALGRPIGTAPKAAVHHRSTPLHLGFSCWLTDGNGRILLSTRARMKRTWPGARTNAFCGHPAPGEDLFDAVRRRARQELGTTLRDLRVALPDFRYTATMNDGTMENEVCPVYTATVDPTTLRPSLDEVARIEWTTLDDLVRDVEREPDRHSPWLLLQLPHLVADPDFNDQITRA